MVMAPCPFQDVRCTTIEGLLVYLNVQRDDIAPTVLENATPFGSRLDPHLEIRENRVLKAV